MLSVPWLQMLSPLGKMGAIVLGAAGKFFRLQPLICAELLFLLILFSIWLDRQLIMESVSQTHLPTSRQFKWTIGRICAVAVISLTASATAIALFFFAYWTTGLLLDR